MWHPFFSWPWVLGTSFNSQCHFEACKTFVPFAKSTWSALSFFKWWCSPCLADLGAQAPFSLDITPQPRILTLILTANLSFSTSAESYVVCETSLPVPLNVHCNSWMEKAACVIADALHVALPNFTFRALHLWFATSWVVLRVGIHPFQGGHPHDIIIIIIITTIIIIILIINWLKVFFFFCFFFFLRRGQFYLLRGPQRAGLSCVCSLWLYVRLLMNQLRGWTVEHGGAVWPWAKRICLNFNAQDLIWLRSNFPVPSCVAAAAAAAAVAGLL